MKRYIAATALTVAMTTAMAGAQSHSLQATDLHAMQAAPALGAPVAPAKALDDMLSLYEKELVGVVEAMPADKYGFAPTTATFAAGSPAKFATVRTFAEEATHSISGLYYFYSGVSGTKPDVDMKAIGAMKTKEQIVPALKAALTFAHAQIATITPENAFLEIKGADGMHTRATLAAFAVAHGYDHYGQMVEYLRMNGVVPPGSK